MSEAFVFGVPVRLADCPPGLFRYNGCLGFKTEYGAMETIGPVNVPGDQVRWTVGRYSEVYVVASGEVFWGGVSSKDDREELLVEPVNAPSEPVPAQGEVSYEVWQEDAFGDGDAMVAGSDSLADAQHYALVYSRDGPVRLVEVTRRMLPTLALARSRGEKGGE